MAYGKREKQTSNDNILNVYWCMYQLGMYQSVQWYKSYFEKSLRNGEKFLKSTKHEDISIFYT